MKKILYDIKKCLACKSCELACAVEHSKTKDLYKALKDDALPIARRHVQVIGPGAKWHTDTLPEACHHCEVAECVLACMSGAMYKDAKTGETKHDPKKCVGCWMCVMSCPFGVISRRTGEKNVFKCDLCPDREVPACVEACPVGALWVEGAGKSEKRKAKSVKLKLKT